MDEALPLLESTSARSRRKWVTAALILCGAAALLALALRGAEQRLSVEGLLHEDLAGLRGGRVALEGPPMSLVLGRERAPLRTPSLSLSPAPSSATARLAARGRAAVRPAGKASAAQLRFATRAVDALVHTIVQQQKRRALVDRQERAMRVASAPQLASDASADATGDVTVGGKQFRLTLLLSAVDTFYQSDEAKNLAADAMAEQAIEAEQGGDGAGQDATAADALAKLESGDLDFENDWANAGEKVVGTGHAGHAAWKVTIWMAERDEEYAKQEWLDQAVVVATEQAASDTLQSTYDLKATEATEAAATVATETASLSDASTSLAAAVQAEADATADVTKNTEAIAAKSTEVETALAAYNAAQTSLTDATSGDSSTVVSDVTTLSTLAATHSALASELSGLEAQTSSLTTAVATAQVLVTSKTTIETMAQTSLTAAETVQTAADTEAETALATLEAQQAVLAAAVEEEARLQGVYDALHDAVVTATAKQDAAAEKAVEVAEEAFNSANTHTPWTLE